MIQYLNGKYTILTELGLIVHSAISNDFRTLKDIIKKRISPETIISYLRQEITDEEITRQLSSVKAIALCTGENCNFRCHYCVYSGIYKLQRLHSQKSMSYKAACKTIDFFLNLCSHEMRLRKDKKLSIGFYGGEPLLNFDLIRQVIDETENLVKKKQLQKKIETEFRLTTNGYLLTDPIIDYLIKKRIFIDISLDGPKEEHDKFRRTVSGKPTWTTIINNIKKLSKNHPDYYSQNVSILCTIHPQHDLLKIENFFKNHPDLININNVTFSLVNNFNLNDSAKLSFERTMNSQQKFEVGPLILKQFANDIISKKLFIKDLSAIRGFTGTCFPGGTKVYIDADGNFHICERINPQFSIGNVNNGFSYEKIRRYIQRYNEEIIRKQCWDCPLWFLCDVCFVHAACETDLTIIDSCRKRTEEKLRILGLYWKKMEDENEPDNHTFNCVDDYLDQLSL